MASSSDGGAVIMFILGIIVIGIVLYISIFVIGAILAAGAAFGGGVSFYNYGKSIKSNVQLEKPIS